MKLHSTLTAAALWLLATASASAATVSASAPTTTIPFTTNATASTSAHSSTVAFVSNAKDYQPIQLKWQTVTLKNIDYQKLLARSKGDDTALVALLLSVGTDKITTVSVGAYDTGYATISATSDYPYLAIDSRTQPPDTTYIQIGLTATIHPKFVTRNLVSAYIDLQDSQVAAPSDIAGGPPSTNSVGLNSTYILSNGHPVLVNKGPQANSGTVQLYILTARFAPSDLAPSR